MNILLKIARGIASTLTIILCALLNLNSALAQPASKGYVDGFTGDSIEGWACTVGYAESVDVHVYVGGYAGNYGALMANGIANLASDGAVEAECASGYYYHRFSVDLSGIKRFGGQSIWVHGINEYGGISVPILNSGTFTVPEPSGMPATPTGLDLNVSIDWGSGQEWHSVTFDPVPGITHYRVSVLRGDTAEHAEALLTSTGRAWLRSPGAPMRYRVAACTSTSLSSCGKYSAPVDR